MPSIAFLAVLAGYVGFQFLQRERALEYAQRYAVQAGMPNARISAHPRPVTPFNWTVFVSDDNAHRFAHINLQREEAKPFRPGDGFFAKLDAPYLPLNQAIWVARARYGETRQALHREAWNSPPLAFFRWFAEEPAFDGETTVGNADCSWFVDLRFDTPGREWMPFRFGACRENGVWRGYDRGNGNEKIPLR
jgi:inner membrane protein